jgi:hypothetical protein
MLKTKVRKVLERNKHFQQRDNPFWEGADDFDSIPKRIARVAELNGGSLCMIGIHDVCEIFNIHPQSLRRMCKNNSIPCRKVNGRYRFLITELLKWSGQPMEEEESILYRWLPVEVDGAFIPCMTTCVYTKDNKWVYAQQQSVEIPEIDELYDKKEECLAQCETLNQLKLKKFI